MMIQYDYEYTNFIFKSLLIINKKLKSRKMLGVVFNRMKKVLSLDREVFAEARDDKNALVSGAVIVIIASIFISIGGLLESFIVPGVRIVNFGSLGFGLLDIIIFPIIMLITWPIIAGYFHIFCKIAGGKVSYTCFLRSMALTYSLGIFAIIPFSGFLIYSIANLLFTYKAIRMTHEFTQSKAIKVFLVSFTGLMLILFGLISTLMNMAPEEEITNFDKIIKEDGKYYVIINGTKRSISDYQFVYAEPDREEIKENETVKFTLLFDSTLNSKEIEFNLLGFRFVDANPKPKDIE